MANEQEPTIYSVAREAQVSISTVSRVLNSPQLVRQETRDRVLKAIDRLGFVPKAAAQAQAKKQIGRVGVLTPFFTHPSFVQRIRGIASVLASNSYELVIYPVESHDQVYYHLETLPVTRRLDGVITMALNMEDTVAERFITNEFPAVLMEFDHPAFSNVLVDNIMGGQLAAEYLLGKGHTQFAFVGDGGVPAYTIRPSEERYTGFSQVLTTKGIELPSERILYPTPEQVLDQIEQLLDRPDRPTAIFATSDELAMQILTIARRKGLAVPTDLAVIGFDDLDFANHIGLTTISQQLDESGKIAAEFLLKQIQNPEQPKLSIKLRLSIVERDTA